MYKNNSRGSSKIKGCSPLQLLCNLTGKCHAVGYYSYTNRWQFQPPPQQQPLPIHISPLPDENIMRNIACRNGDGWRIDHE